MKLWQHGPTEAWYYRQAITGDSIQTAVWTVDPTGPLLDNQTNDETSAQVRVRSLTRGIKYRLSVHVVTLGGQTMDRSVSILCVDQ